MLVRIFLSSGLLCLASCSAANADSQMTVQDTAAASSWLKWHDTKRAVDQAVNHALLGSGGADYPTAIAVVRGSDRPQSVKDFEIGNLIVTAYETARVARMPVESIDAGVATLERAALGSGEGADLAPGTLHGIFADGAGKPPRATITPNPKVAACWERVKREKTGARACIDLRLRH